MGRHFVPINLVNVVCPVSTRWTLEWNFRLCIVDPENVVLSTRDGSVAGIRCDESS